MFGRAWELIRRNKQLWALGFVAALSGDLLSNIRIGPELNLAGNGPLLTAGVFDFRTWGRALRLLGSSLVGAGHRDRVGGGHRACGGFVRQSRPGRGDALAHTYAASHSTWRPRCKLWPNTSAPLVQVTVLLYGPLFADRRPGRRDPASAPRSFPAAAVPGAAGPCWLSRSCCLSYICWPSVASCWMPVPPRLAVERSWAMLQQNWRRWLVLLGALLSIQLVCSGLAQLVLEPVAGVSLLSLALTSLRNGYPRSAADPSA